MIHTRDIIELLDRAAGPNRWTYDSAGVDIAQWHLSGNNSIIRDGKRFYKPATIINNNRRKRLRAHQILGIIEAAAIIDPDVAARLAKPGGCDG